jgi:hypothetical protein
MHDTLRRTTNFNLEFVRGTALFNLVREPGNEVRVIFGGNDGILITIDANGVIHVLPPEGPGDPEIRAAVTAILNGVQTLNDRIGAGGQPGIVAA